MVGQGAVVVAIANVEVGVVAIVAELAVVEAMVLV